ncbi:MAG: winged helix-turn-helix domain-containing protein, partial [Woeseiaceae bacterium]
MGPASNLRKGFSFGDWEVLPDRGLIRDGEREERVEPLPMNVLVALAEQQGEVLTRNDLIDRVWEGRPQGDEPLNRCISVLRNKLGDDSKSPAYIENIPRVGYRLMKPVLPRQADRPGAAESAPVSGPTLWRKGVFAAVIAIAMLVLLLRGCPTTHGQMPSIAVYQFVCASNTEEFLCYGFSEELASTLLQSGRVKLVKLQDPYSAGTGAARLEVERLLFGSVQRMGDDLKIFAEVKNNDTGESVALVTAEGSVDDLFDLQEDIAGKVAGILFPDDPPEMRSLSRSASSQAFAAYAQGLVQFERRTRFAIEESTESFQFAIELDPGFGPSYLRLAHAYLLLPDYNPSLDVAQSYDRAAAIAAEGVAADFGIREAAESVRGFIHHKRREWMDATRAFETAIGAGNPETFNWYSRFLATTGRSAEALEYAEAAYAGAPDNPTIVSRLAIANLFAGNLDEAGPLFEIASEKLYLQAPLHDLAYSVYLVATDDVLAAREFAKAGLQQYGAYASWVDTVFDGIDDPDKRETSIRMVDELETSGRLARYVVLSLWGLLGEADRAIDTANSILAVPAGQDAEMGLEILFSAQLAFIRE